MPLSAIMLCMMFVVALPFAIVWLHKKLWWGTPSKPISEAMRLKKDLRRSVFLIIGYGLLGAFAIISLADLSLSVLAQIFNVIQVVCWWICLGCEIKHYQYVQWQIKTQKTQPAH